MCTANKNIPKTVLVHVCHWPYRYVREGRYPDTSFNHRVANGAAAVPPVQDRMTAPYHFLWKGAQFVLYLQEISGRVSNLQSSVQWRMKYQSWENIILVKLLPPVLKMCLPSDGPCWTNGWQFSHLLIQEGNLSSEQNNVNCLSMGRTSQDVLFHCKVSHKSRFAECEFFMSSSTEDAVNATLYDKEIFIFHNRFLAGKFCCAVEKVGISQRPYTAIFILDTLSGCDRITFTHSVNVMSRKLDEMLASGKFLTYT